MSYEGRTVFTRGALVVGIVAIAGLLFASGTVVTYYQRGWDWLSVGFGLATVVLGLGGLVEAAIERVELTPGTLVVRRLWGVRRYDVHDIQRVEEAKGGPPAVLLTNGGWINLPDVGPHFGNSMRAWLRAHRAGTKSEKA
jgi:hypothetical protein